MHQFRAHVKFPTAFAFTTFVSTVIVVVSHCFKEARPFLCFRSFAHADLQSQLQRAGGAGAQRRCADGVGQAALDCGDCGSCKTKERRNKKHINMQLFKHMNLYIYSYMYKWIPNHIFMQKIICEYTVDKSGPYWSDSSGNSG